MFVGFGFADGVAAYLFCSNLQMVFEAIGCIVAGKHFFFLKKIYNCFGQFIF